MSGESLDHERCVTYDPPRADGHAQLTLCRSGRGNSLDTATVDALRAGVARARYDHAASLTIQADGRNFCTGFDLTGYEAQSAGDLLLRFVRIEQLLQDLASAPYLTVARAQGRAWGAGADLVAACDVRTGRPDANLRFPGMSFGIVLGTGRLVDLVGRLHAQRLTLDGRTVDADEALEIGLLTDVSDVQQVPPDDTVLARAAPWPTARQALRRSDPDADLARLVRSAAAPGIHDRIAAYLASMGR